MGNNLLVYVEGRVCSDVEVVSDYGLEKVYRVHLAIKRRSGVEDIIALHYSNSVTCELLMSGDYYSVEGDLRSVYMKGGDEGGLYIYASSLVLLEREPQDCRNLVKGIGVLHCDPVLRTKWDDDRVAITDLMLEVDRGRRKRSCIPVVAWNSKARVCTLLKGGDSIYLEGRLQSRRKNGSSKGEVSLYKISLADVNDAD